MRTQRVTLAPDDIDAVDGRGHLLVGREELHLVGVRVTEGRIHSRGLGSLDDALVLGARKRSVIELLDAPGLARFLVHGLETSGLDGKKRRAVGLDMVGVSV